MIFFHEGLPRSGKSYESMVEHVIPSLKKGRQVYAYIDGINYQKISELTAIPEPFLKKMLIQLNENQIHDIYNHVTEDSLVVIDELQNFFPSERQKLTDEMRRFIAEHGHQGIDILIMGQALADIHTTWRRRVAKKVVFTKLDMVGRPNSYKWEIYAGQLAGGKNEPTYRKVNSGIKKYDPQYFGTYKSHTDDATNYDNYEDKRATVFADWRLKWGVPAVFIFAIYCMYYVYNVFVSEPQTEPEQAQKEFVTTTQSDIVNTPEFQAEMAKLKAQQQPQPEPVQLEEPQPPADINRYFLDMIDNNNARLAGLIRSETKDEFIIEVLNDSYHKQDYFTKKELLSAGYQYELVEHGLILTYGEEQRLIRMKPVDLVGHVSQTHNNHLRNSAGSVYRSNSKTYKNEPESINTFVLTNPGIERHGGENIGSPANSF